jgi:hypothetical protein
MDMQPGQVIAPHDEEAKPSSVAQNAAAPISTIEPVTAISSSPTAPSPESVAPQPSLQSSAAPEAPQTRWQAQTQADGQQTAPLPGDIEWSAAEFIEHPKNTRWYALLVLAAVVLATTDYFITKDLISTTVIVIATAMFGFYAGRKPHTRQYRLGPQGLQIGEKTYGFQNYKHFSVLDEGAISSIVFTPMKRFEVPLTIYVASDIEEGVLDYLTTFLPIERHQVDAVDGLLRRIKF